ncbi:MAG: PQQ-dependent sugar dehydrogenase [Pseudonocardia sp.]|nr:PQQ-dependent sugar dehydrogenase [Pseudonocardia sp.]
MASSIAVALVVALLAGCASFPDTGPRQWRDKPEGGGPLAAPPRVPDSAPESTPEQPPAQPGQAIPMGCIDPDPQVVATCLSPLSAIAVLPDPESALVAERATGRILRVHKGKDPEVVATVPVDPAGGGLIGLVLSPSYADDQLLYAYAATPTDHRVVRISPGDPPVPVLTGIPRTHDDSGALGVGKDGALLVATGGSGALGGKLLRIDTFGHPFKDNPDPHSLVYSSGLHAPSGLCTSVDSGTVWATDHLPERDVLQRITPGQLGDPAWSWPDRPGVAGCVAPPGALAIAERGASALFLLRLSAPTAFTGTPQQTLGGTYGRLGATALAPDGLIWLGTTNKGGGGPMVSSDDRAIRIQPPSGGGGSGPD